MLVSTYYNPLLCGSVSNVHLYQDKEPPQIVVHNRINVYTLYRMTLIVYNIVKYVCIKPYHSRLFLGLL